MLTWRLLRRATDHLPLICCFFDCLRSAGWVGYSVGELSGLSDLMSCWMLNLRKDWMEDWWPCALQGSLILLF